MPSWGTSAQFAITATIPRSFSLPPASSDQLAVVPTANVDLDDHATATFACAKMAAVPVDRAVCRYHIAVALGSYRPRQVVYAKGTKLTLASLMFLKIRLRSQRICLWTTSSRCSLRLLVLLLGFDRHMFWCSPSAFVCGKSIWKSNECNQKSYVQGLESSWRKVVLFVSRKPSSKSTICHHIRSSLSMKERLLTFLRVCKGTILFSTILLSIVN